MGDRIQQAGEAIRSGDLVVYPTETVYGLGGDALDESVVKQVFRVKQRPRNNPLSVAFESIQAAAAMLELAERTVSFMKRFLPGPVTVLTPTNDSFPRALTAGQPDIGVRIPDHELALALLGEVQPITATSANISGRGSITNLRDLDPAVRAGATVILDGGETPGTESTVVSPETNTIYREGALSTPIEQWLQNNP